MSQKDPQGRRALTALGVLALNILAVWYFLSGAFERPIVPILLLLLLEVVVGTLLALLYGLYVRPDGTIDWPKVKQALKEDIWEVLIWWS